jgi:predicted ester cyclase
MATTETERNKATFRSLVDALNSNDAQVLSNAIDEFFEPDVRISTPLPLPPGVTGTQAFKLVFTTLHRAYPDLHVELKDVIGEGDRVVGRDVVTGTHQGEFMGIPPTGKAVTYNEIFIARFVNGRIAETWGVVDVMAVMQQLGVIPASPRSNSE